MLFYLKDRQEALREIKRVLKPGGMFLCSTYGSRHMQEITRMVQEFDQRITLSANHLYEEFGLENGKEQLMDVFSDVQREDYEDELLVDQPEPLISYILSCHGNQHEYLASRYLEFKEFVRRRVEEEGRMKITKNAGIFLCRG